MSMVANGQNRSTAIAQASKLFAHGNWERCAAVLTPVCQPNERDPKICYYLGASEAMLGRNLEMAVQRLQLAALRGFNKRDADLYIGRALQLRCEYEDAAAALGKFAAQTPNDSLRALATRLEAECENAAQLSAKFFSLTTLKSTRCGERDLLEHYHASREVGAVSRNSHFFERDIDPEGLMYMTERGDAVYFSLPDNGGHSHLMRMEKLIGGWSEMTPLPGTSADGNDKTPVLMTDGVTLYFSSDRAGGYGGYDIYRSVYDAESRQWGAPVNVGLPFNSPWDDELFVCDEFSQRAWFSSTRETHRSDSVSVYEVLWDGSQLRNMAQSTEELRTALSMPVSTLSGGASTAAAQKPRGGAAPVKLMAQLNFVVCDTLTYTQWEEFSSPTAARTYRQVLRAVSEKDSLTALMAAGRTEFAALTSTPERNAKLQTLLRIERSIYTLDDEIAEKTEAARNDELSSVAGLVSSGEWSNRRRASVTKKSQSIDWSHFLRAENFASYNAVFFTEARGNADEEVRALFTAAERSELELQDSLMAWSSIIVAESRTMQQNAALGVGCQATSADGRLTTLSVEETLERAGEYRIAAATLTSRAQDAKRAIYERRYQALLATLDGYDTSELQSLHDKATHYFELVADVTPATASVEKCDQALTMKRRGMSNLDKCLQRYLAHADGTFPLGAIKEPGTGNKEHSVKIPGTGSIQGTGSQELSVNQEQCTVKIPPSAPVSEPSAGPSASAGVAAPPVSPGGGEWRLQIGAFRSRPAALEQMPNPQSASQVYLPERRLTRFFYGHYASRSEAEKDIPVAAAAGFGGAFPVQFDAQGKQL